MTTAPPPAIPRAEWARRISDCWQASVDAIFEVGQLLVDAKARLAHGDFEAMVEDDLPFKPPTARRLMIVARDHRLTKRAHVHALPASWGTLYELTKLDDATFDAKVEDGTIRADMERSDVVRLRKGPQVAGNRQSVDGGGTVDDLAVLVEQGRTFGAIYADPPWDYETWSDKGQDRSASQHYGTMTLDQLADLPVGELAADDCVLHLWTISTLLDAGIELIRQWGFAYKKVGFVWGKTVADGSALKMITGKWTRDEAELCLLATRGTPERLDAGVRQVLLAPLGDHSAKPDEFRDRIVRLSGGPYLELFGRKAVPGWLVWGNQVEWHAESQAKVGVEVEAGAAETEPASRLATGRTVAATSEHGRDSRERPAPILPDIPEFLVRT